jgi:hypothetical protein
VSEQGRGVEAPRVVAPGVGLVSADVAEPVTGDRQHSALRSQGAALPQSRGAVGGGDAASAASAVTAWSSGLNDAGVDLPVAHDTPTVDDQPGLAAEPVPVVGAMVRGDQDTVVGADDLGGQRDALERGP